MGGVGGTRARSGAWPSSQGKCAHGARRRVERVHGIIGREERSCESFAVTPAHAPTPLLAFLGNEGHIPLVSLKSHQASSSRPPLVAYPSSRRRVLANHEQVARAVGEQGGALARAARAWEATQEALLEAWRRPTRRALHTHPSSLA